MVLLSVVYSFANIVTQQTQYTPHNYQTISDRDPIVDLARQKTITATQPLVKKYITRHLPTTKRQYHNSLETDEDYTYHLNKPVDESKSVQYVNNQEFDFTVTTPSRNPNLTSSEQAYDYMGYRGTLQPYYKWLYKLWIDEKAEKRRTEAAYSFPTPIFKKELNNTPFPVPQYYIKHFLYFYQLDLAIKAQDERRAAASKSTTKQLSAP